MEVQLAVFKIGSIPFKVTIQKTRSGILQLSWYANNPSNEYVIKKNATCNVGIGRRNRCISSIVRLI